MTPPIPIILVCEDLLSEAVIRNVISQIRIPYVIGPVYGLCGVGYIKKKIAGFNKAAKGTPYLVLLDLNNHTCPPLLLAELLPRGKNPNLIVRIAVREIEAWVLSDRKAVSSFLGVGISQIPINPDRERDPKKRLIEVAKKSRYRSIREAIVPRPGSIGKQGPGYNEFLCSFIRDYWNLDQASLVSESLERTKRYLISFQPTWENEN